MRHLPRYIAVAFSSFLVDYFLFVFFSYFIFEHYLYAHVTARLGSGCFNFFANRMFVFRSKEATFPELLRYCGAFVFSMYLSGFFLYLLVDAASLPTVSAKPCAELAVFILNFFILQKVVFSRLTVRSTD